MVTTKLTCTPSRSQYFNYYIDTNISTKSLVEILCSAREYDLIRNRKWNIRSIQEDCQRLLKAIGEELPNSGKPRTKIPYAILGTVLVFAHLLRDIKSLQEPTRQYLNHLLTNAHR
jgi:hypothetical protein